MVSRRVAESLRGVGFVGSYLPRACGIATFTYDLAEAFRQIVGPGTPVIVAAVNDRADGYNYPPRVKHTFRDNNRADFSNAADFLNSSAIDVVSLQHEFGLFGGESGMNVLTLLDRLRKPVVVTCHTVFAEPDEIQREVFQDVVAKATRLVVMNERAAQLIRKVYAADADKVTIIPHGVHPFPFVDPDSFKPKFGLQGRHVLMTFGLLSRGKGIEHVIAALPRVVKQYPEVMYVILGATHPHILRAEGEAYRLELERLVARLELKEHVRFDPRFVELDELLDFIGASDVCVTPYLEMDRITSGVLSYVMAMGKAVVSTPYHHAVEALADGRGHLVPPADPPALARALLSVLGDEHKTTAMRKRAYAYCQRMAWPVVASEYARLFEGVRVVKRARESVRSARVSAIAAERVVDARTPLQW